MKKGKPYQSLYEKTTSPFEADLLALLDKAIVKLSEARDFLQKANVGRTEWHNEGIKEAVNISSKNFQYRISQFNTIMTRFWNRMDEADESGRELSLYLFVMCRSKLVGTNTAITINGSTSSQRSGSNMRSLITEMTNMDKTRRQEIVFRIAKIQFMLSCDYFNAYVKGHKADLKMKSVTELLIPARLYIKK